jgi:tRNA A37 threonylcarbamoyladenosine dehydratase
MMETIFDRTKLVIGEANQEKLKNSKVVILGLGGVGSYIVEALARVGIEELIIVDFDVVTLTNKNRQLLALDSTIGFKKTKVIKDRIYEINKNCKVIEVDEFIDENNVEQIIPIDSDFVIDAIDKINSKVAIIDYCFKNNIRVISSMGTGNKLDPFRLEHCDIFETKNDPLAKKMRALLRKKGINKLEVIYSDELPIRDSNEYEKIDNKATPGSISYLPSIAGLMIASVVIRRILGE